MPISRYSTKTNLERETPVVFHVHETIEVYDGSLALAIDHLLNHIKALISLAYLPGAEDLQKALARHPVLRRAYKDPSRAMELLKGRTPDRVLLKECQHLMEMVVEIANLSAWPETSEQAQMELEILQAEVPFLDYRYDNDPYPSDRDREE